MWYVLSVWNLGNTDITEVCGGGKQHKATHFSNCSARNQRPGLPFLPCLPCHPSWQVPCRAYFWQEPVWICHILSRCANQVQTEMCPNNRYILVVTGNHSKKEVLCFWSLSLKLKLFQVAGTDRNCSFTDTSV